MRVHNLGESVEAVLLTGLDVDVVLVRLTPAGFKKHLGTVELTAVSRYLYDIPLTLLYCKKVEKIAKCTVNDPQYEVRGPVLIFHRGEPFESLKDFEVSVIKDSIAMAE